MQETSQTFRVLRSAGGDAVTTVTVAGTALPTYVSLRTQRQLLSADKLVGNCFSAQIDLSILAGGLTIPRMAEIRLALAMTDGAQTSEAIPKGTYYIDTRQTEPDAELGNVTTIHGYDAMLKMEQPMIPAGSPSGAWPRTCRDVMDEIAQRIGVELDPRTELRPYLVQYPDTILETDSSGSTSSTGMTMRTVAGYIASMHGGNWTITEAGKLYLVPLVPLDYRDVSLLGDSNGVYLCGEVAIRV